MAGRQQQGARPGATPRPAGSAPRREPLVEILRVHKKQNPTEAFKFDLEVLARVSRGVDALKEMLVLLVNDVRRTEPSAMAETNPTTGTVTLRTTIDTRSGPGHDGDPIEIQVIIAGTVVGSVPITVELDSLSATPPPTLATPPAAPPTKIVAVYPDSIMKEDHLIPISVTDVGNLPTKGTVTATHPGGSAPYAVGDAGHLVPVTVPDGETWSVLFTCPGTTPVTVVVKGKAKPTAVTPPAQAKKLIAICSGVKQARHKVLVGALDKDDKATSANDVRAVYKSRCDPHDVTSSGKVIEFITAPGETLVVKFECVGATPAEVTLEGEDKAPTVQLARVELEPTGTDWDKKTGASMTLATPRAYGEDGKGAACDLHLISGKPIQVIQIKDGVETDLGTRLQFVISVEAKPVTAYRFVNPHKRRVQVDADVVGVDAEINNMHLPAAKPVAGKWRQNMSATERAEYYRRGGM